MYKTPLSQCMVDIYTIFASIPLGLYKTFFLTLADFQIQPINRVAPYFLLFFLFIQETTTNFYSSVLITVRLARGLLFIVLIKFL